MDGIVFRLMYENCISGVICSGTAKDNLDENLLDFKYVAGVDHITEEIRDMQGKKRLLERKRGLDYFFLGSMTLSSIGVLVEEIGQRKIRTVILPYVPPTERLALITRYKNKQEMIENELEFLADPDMYMKKHGVENRLFLYENGVPLPNNYEEMDTVLKEMKPGHYLEKCCSKDEEIVMQLEGHAINLRKAGYIFDSGWLFYFSVHGLDLSQKHTLKEPEETLVLFSAPIRSRSKDYEAKLFAVSLNQRSCCNESLNREISGCVKCLHEQDHIVFCTATNDPVPHGVTGHFLLGNYNLNKELGSMLGRYSGIREMIRVVSVPSCGKSSHWNRIFPSLFAGDYSKYWFVNVTEQTDSRLMLDIANTSPRNRFFLGKSHVSYCVSGVINRKKKHEL